MATTATTQINDHNFTLDEGKFYAKGQQPVVLEDIDTSKGTFVRFEAADGKSNLFGWSLLAGGIVDGSDIDQKQILFGGAPNGSSTITGGNRNDSIYADGKRVVISGGAGQIIKVKDPNGTTYVGQLGKELTYNDDVEYYGNIQGDTTCAISVGADYSGSEVTVYLNGARELDGHSRTYMNVNKIDASAFTGNASLVGAELDDYIIAAQGDTSLWGGNGGNDILVGAGYGNTFFYTKGDGNDQIRNAADGDVINLGDITLDDISSTLIMNAGVKLDFKDGGSLMLANGADVTFKLADGTSYSADYNSHSWKAND